MKKILTVAVLTVALVGVRVQTAQARGCAAGAIFTGVVAGAVLVDALRPAPVYYSAPVCYAQPAPVVYAAPACSVVYPAPTVVYAAPRQVIYVAPAPVVVRRAPVVRFGFGYVRAWHCR